MSRLSATLGGGATLFAALLLLAPACERGPRRSVDEILAIRALGLAYMEENSLDGAEAEFRQLTEMLPDESMGFANLGLVYLRKGSYREAERNMRRALELEPGDPDVRLMLAKLLERTGRRDEARRQLERAVRDTPRHVKSLYALAHMPAAGQAGGGREQREGYLRKLVEVTPSNMAARLLLIEALLRNNKPDEGLAHVEQLRARLPELPAQAESFHDAAVEHMRNGRADRALQSMVALANFVKLTQLYREAIVNLEGPGDELICSPIVSFSRPLAAL